MGLSHIKGNSGFLGVDRRGETGTSGGTGSVSVRKHFLERRRGNFEPISPTKVYSNPLFEDNFETGDFSKWIDFSGTTGVRNTTGTDPSTWNVGGAGVTNEGNAGQALPYSGSNSAFISFDGGSTFGYRSNGADTGWISHIFVDICPPPWTTALTLTFAWTCNGENAAGASNYDFGYVMYTTRDVLPGFPVAGNGYTGARVGATTNEGKFNDTYDAAADTGWVLETATITEANNIYLSATTGDYGRLTFSWQNDSSIENQAPWAIDNVKVVYSPENP